MKLYDTFLSSLFRTHDFLLSCFFKGRNAGYEVSSISPENKKKLLSIFNQMRPIEYKRSSHLTKFYVINFTEDDYKIYNEQHTWYDLRDINFDFLINDLSPFIKRFIGSNFKVVNVRSFKTIPSAKSFGPLKFHTDGFFKGHLKIMIYKDEMNVDNGFLIVEDKHIITDQKCSAVIFKNSDVLHNGVAGLSSARHAIEITLQRTFLDYNKITIGLPNDRHLKFPLI